MIELGKTYRDTATGRVGVACARMESLHGPIQIRLDFLGSDGLAKEQWFMAGRLVEQDATSPGAYA